MVLLSHLRQLMLKKCCAAWLVVLTISPFTAPFMVCELNVVIGQIIDRDARPVNDLEEWFVNGATLDLPVAPAAGELQLASFAALGAVGFVEMLPAAPFDVAPVAPIPLGRAPTLAVLRL